MASNFDSNRYYDCESRREDAIAADERAEAEAERRAAWAEEDCPDCGERNRCCTCIPVEAFAPAPGPTAEHMARLAAEIEYLKRIYGGQR